MENVYIPPSNETPEVNFRFSEHNLSIAGESYPENAMAFYAPVRASLQDYLESKAPENGAEAHFSLKYFNSSSTKLIRSLFSMLHDAALSGKKIATHWYHDPDDEMIMEFGQDLKEEFSMMDLQIIAREGA